MDVEAVAKHLLGLGQLAVTPQLLRELEKEPALRIGLEPELQLFEFGVDAGLSHVLDFEFCSTTGGGATSAAETNRPNEWGGSENRFCAVLLR